MLLRKYTGILGCHHLTHVQPLAVGVSLHWHGYQWAYVPDRLQVTSHMLDILDAHLTLGVHMMNADRQVPGMHSGLV